jgi:hypothetical protein
VHLHSETGESLIHVISQLKLRFQNHWRLNLHDDSNSLNGNKLRNYRLYKSSFCKEPYLDLCDYVKRKHLASLRLSCHKLRIETGRHVHMSERLNPCERKCTFCPLQTCEDEFHFVMICPFYSSLRDKFMLNVKSKFPFISDYSPKTCYLWIMANLDSFVITNLSLFITQAFAKRFSSVQNNELNLDRN